MEFIILSIFITTVVIGAIRANPSSTIIEEEETLVKNIISQPLEKVETTTTSNIFSNFFFKCYNFFFGKTNIKSTDIVESVPEVIPEPALEVVPEPGLRVISAHFHRIPLEDLDKYIDRIIAIEFKLFRRFFSFLKKHIDTTLPEYEELPVSEGIERFNYLGDKVQSAVDFATYSRLFIHLEFCKQYRYIDPFLIKESFASSIKRCEDSFGQSTIFFETHVNQHQFFFENALLNMDTYINVKVGLEQRVSSKIFTDFFNTGIFDETELSYVYDEFFPNTESFIANYEPYILDVAMCINTVPLS